MDRDVILRLNLEGLRNKLDELGLSKMGNKNVLQDRLLSHFNEDRAEEMLNSDEASSVAAGDVATMSYSTFTLRDVQDSVSSFSGDGLPEIRQWLDEFEDCSCAVKWNDLQKYIYAKQLLKGAARTFIRSESGIRDWCSLKQALVKEFGRKLSSLEVHKTLRGRKKKSGETLREYLYSLREIGNPIGLDDESLIEYFIDGISDYRSNKAILYQAKTLDELKVQIGIYEKVRSSASSNTRGTYGESSVDDQKMSDNRETNFRKNETDVKDKKRCFRCGESGHLSNVCKSAEVKCFKCKGFGHKSFECRVDTRDEKIKNESTSGSGNINNMSDKIIVPSRRIFKDILVCGKEISAFIDTGSDISAVRYDALYHFSDVNIRPEIKTLEGIGGRCISTIGSFTVGVRVDNVEFDVTFHVCKNNDILYPIILGNDVFDHVNLMLGSKGAKFEYKTKIAYKEIKKLPHKIEAKCEDTRGTQLQEKNNKVTVATYQEKEENVDSYTPSLDIRNYWRQRLEKPQLDDEWIVAVRQVLEYGPFEDYFEKFNVLHRDPNKELIIAPRSMTDEIIKNVHHQGHFNSHKTQVLVENTFYIPFVKEKVDKVVKSCTQCSGVSVKGGDKIIDYREIDRGKTPLKKYRSEYVDPVEDYSVLKNYENDPDIRKLIEKLFVRESVESLTSSKKKKENRKSKLRTRKCRKDKAHVMAYDIGELALSKDPCNNNDMRKFQFNQCKK